MANAPELIKRHFETFVADPLAWRELLADDVVWELPYAVALGHTSKISGRDEAVRQAQWFVGAVEKFRFFDLRVHPFADSDAAAAEVKAEGVITATGRIYRQEYVMFLRAAGGKIVFLREYFDPTRAASAMNTPILGLESAQQKD